MKRPQMLSLIYSLVLAGLMLAVTVSALPALAAGTGDDAAAEGPETPVALNSRIEVSDRYVRLGDLFQPAGKYAERAVARAPAPGQSAELGAVWLWKVARTFGVAWRPTSKLDTATVVRPSREVTTDEIRELLRTAYFEETGEDELIEIDLDDDAAALHLSADVIGAATVARFSLDQNSGRFSATITGPGDTSDAARSLTLGGKAVRLVEVPTPVRRLNAGTLIEDGDLTLTRLPAKRVNRSAVVDMRDLLGKEATRTLVAGRPIAATSVDLPELVRKNTRVTIVLQTDNMRLTAQGRALQSGALDEMVRVQNTHSNITIDAVVSGENRVMVSLPARLAAQ